MTTNYSYSLEGSSFKERWAKDLTELRQLDLSDDAGVPSVL